ncbi:MAG: ATP-binding protein [Woeseiaceae bacterium]
MSPQDQQSPTNKPFRQVLAALAASLFVGALGTYAWNVLQQHEIEHTAATIEKGSYANRAELAKQLERQFHALRQLADFWSDYGHLSPELWDDDAQIELSHYQGFETILWDDPKRGVRYVISANGDPSLRYRPDDDEWRTLAPLRKGATDDGQERVLGRSKNDAGHVVYRVEMPASGPDVSGIVIAAINAHKQLDQVLGDELPGFAIRVSWDGDTIYSRNNPATNVPESWTQGGMIQLPVGSMWRVTHTPTPEAADDLSRPTMPGLLAAIWGIALLFGVVIYLYGRVLDRAASAEAAQARYAALNSNLEKQVNERTRDLVTISQSIVHDIRGALNVICLSSRAVRAEQPSEESAEAVDRIERAISQTQTILDRTHAFGEVASAEMRREKVDMQAIVERLCDELIDREETELSIGDLPACSAQPLLVEILWHNLIENAVKFSRESPNPSIVIDADRNADPIVYRLRDNGIGFESEKADSIFKPFTRLGSQDKPGHGIGLTLVARIVERHGGSVSAESEPGDGATFSFDLGADSSLHD